MADAEYAHGLNHKALFCSSESSGFGPFLQFLGPCLAV